MDRVLFDAGDDEQATGFFFTGISRVRDPSHLAFSPVPSRERIIDLIACKPAMHRRKTHDHFLRGCVRRTALHLRHCEPPPSALAQSSEAPKRYVRPKRKDEAGTQDQRKKRSALNKLIPEVAPRVAAPESPPPAAESTVQRKRGRQRGAVDPLDTPGARCPFRQPEVETVAMGSVKNLPVENTLFKMWTPPKTDASAKKQKAVKTVQRHSTSTSQAEAQAQAQAKAKSQAQAKAKAKAKEKAKKQEYVNANLDAVATLGFPTLQDVSSCSYGNRACC